MAKKGFTVIIDEELWKKFSIKCIQDGRTKAETLTALLGKYVEKK